MSLPYDIPETAFLLTLAHYDDGFLCRGLGLTRLLTDVHRAKQSLSRRAGLLTERHPESGSLRAGSNGLDRDHHCASFEARGRRG